MEKERARSQEEVKVYHGDFSSFHLHVFQSQVKSLKSNLEVTTNDREALKTEMLSLEKAKQAIELDLAEVSERKPSNILLKPTLDFFIVGLP